MSVDPLECERVLCALKTAIPKHDEITRSMLAEELMEEPGSPKHSIASQQPVSAKLKALINSVFVMVDCENR